MAMALSIISSSCITFRRPSSSDFSGLNRRTNGGLMDFRSIKRENHSVKVKASCFFDSINQPILKEALKEPVAFIGGMFAGVLRLDLEEEPLKEWVTRTVEASGMTVEDVDDQGSMPEEQIEIE
ncbi:UPF0426 protein At1g28150, chloroplastic isoform X2 [Mercurialis annua]|uniref:UPF0426 protein At1g28150, chloroplastic isoform X2 n=1 Tax=Mercurialis annua TaxID=3986 RepID=UPI00215EC8FB|nr:UPF0426 protein At1g28150, chloroplastic isoform X2 [Mercurialis annua]